ncbi:POTRA domain-containing protein [Desulfurobacterium thermolithotrophum]|uniref:POTRA domain-containing protein n=1 Tax=Desulfurobacterium thermolithotrophum TaxID=64160 RepID=UPI0013D38137|nr:POTRA domain-containing protein [Desulfurobacterium thermolithotrophum]
MRTLLLLLFLLLLPMKTYSAVIEKIEIIGLKWTKEKFVRRELLLKEGDTFSKEKLKNSIRNLLNTHLFYRITPEVKEKDGKVTVVLKTKERFPIVPIPKFRAKTNGTFKTGIEIRDYNFRGMGNHIFLGLTKWFKNEHSERNFYINSMFYRIIKDRIDVGITLNFFNSYNNVFTKDNKVLGNYNLKSFKANIYMIKYLDLEKIRRLMLSFRPEINRYSNWIESTNQYYLSLGFTVDKTTDMVYYTEGSFYSFYIDFAEPNLSTVFTGSLIGTYNNSLKRGNVNTFSYGGSVGTKIGYSGNGFLLDSGIPGYVSDKVKGKRFFNFKISHRLALINKTVFIKPTIAGGDAFSNIPDNFLISPGFEVEAFWARLVDGIIRFKIFKGIGNGSDVQTSLKLGFRW